MVVGNAQTHRNGQHREPRGQDMRHQEEARSNIGQPCKSRGGLYEKQAWGGRRQFGQGEPEQHNPGGGKVGS